MAKNKGGRKPKIIGSPRIITASTKLSENEIKKIEDIAKYFDMPKMTLIRNMILNELDFIETFNRNDNNVKNIRDYICRN